MEDNMDLRQWIVVLLVAVLAGGNMHFALPTNSHVSGYAGIHGVGIETEAITVGINNTNNDSAYAYLQLPDLCADMLIYYEAGKLSASHRYLGKPFLAPSGKYKGQMVCGNG